MNWHEEVLDAKGLKAAGRMAQTIGSRFYLAGDTALALRLGHRISLDLDLFSRDDRLQGAERENLLQRLGRSGGLEVIEEKDGTCHLRVEGTLVSLFHYRYPLLKPTRPWRGLAVASLEDVAAMKLSAVLGRGSSKDFVDLYFLCKELSVDKVLKAGKHRYRDHAEFILQAMKALVYFEDAEKEPLPRLLSPVRWSDIRAYFEREIPKAASRDFR